MTKQNEYAFAELVNNDDGFMIIRYDTMDDFSHKVDMIETEQYTKLKQRFIEAVRKVSVGGNERNTLPVQQPAVQQPVAAPPVQQPLPQAQPQPQAQPLPQQGDNATVHALASQYNTPDEYLMAIDFHLSEKEHPHIISYFRTEKSGNVSTAYLNVFKGKDGLWGMTKWLIREKKPIKYDPSWGYPYTEIIAVVDEIAGRNAIQGN